MFSLKVTCKRRFIWSKPTGFKDLKAPYLACKPYESLYGLKQPQGLSSELIISLNKKFSLKDTVVNFFPGYPSETHCRGTNRAMVTFIPFFLFIKLQSKWVLRIISLQRVSTRNNHILQTVQEKIEKEYIHF